MSKMRFECGSCDYSIDLNEKLQSHYMGVHDLSHRDANVLVYQKEFLMEDIQELIDETFDKDDKKAYEFWQKVQAL